MRGTRSRAPTSSATACGTWASTQRTAGVAGTNGARSVSACSSSGTSASRTTQCSPRPSEASRNAARVAATPPLATRRDQSGGWSGGWSAPLGPPGIHSVGASPSIGGDSVGPDSVTDWATGARSVWIRICAGAETRPPHEKGPGGSRHPSTRSTRCPPNRTGSEPVRHWVPFGAPPIAPPVGRPIHSVRRIGRRPGAGWMPAGARWPRAVPTSLGWSPDPSCAPAVAAARRGSRTAAVPR